MPVQIGCPNPECGASYSVGDANLGKVGRCKKCGTKFPLVPGTRDGGPPSMPETDLDSAPRQHSEPKLPESFGRYKIVRLLGRGGMGSVYLALDTQLKRQVALKVPHTVAFTDRPDVRARFFREAEAAARFHHPNFCPIHDIGEADGVPFLTMAFIEGETLSASIEKDQGWPPRKAAEVARQLAVALAELHRQGIIHRDLKPANIMVDARGGLVLMDFGLARWYDELDSTFTPTGAILGTPAYMPPEQAEGNLKVVGPRSDLYSLGVILYELLTGRRPFEGPITLVLGLIVLVEPAPPSTLRPDLDPRLEAICLKAMAKKSENRYASMEEFAGALTAYLSEDAAPSAVVSPRAAERQAAQTFADVVGRESISLRGGRPPVKPASEASEDRSPAPRSRSPLLNRVVIAATAFAALLFGIVYVAPGKGRVKKDPPASPKVDAPLITNTLGMNLKLIPAGEFDMGSDATDPVAGDDEKVDGKKHRVRITEPFYLGTTEVTVGQFRQFVARTNYKTEVEKDGKGAIGWNEAKLAFEQDPKSTWLSPGFPQDDDHPVVNVSWNDAVAFCEWLSQQEGKTYRLPTEAEWEYACRAGRETRYPSGDDPESLATVGNVADGTAREKHPDSRSYAIQAKDGYVYTAPVGRFRPNAFGLYDMHGNAWEWCADWSDPGYYAKSPAADPMNSTPAVDRVTRGGGWASSSRRARSANRSGSLPGPRRCGCDTSFRVARAR